MGENQRCVFLLLISVVLSYAQDEETSCLMAKRYKSSNKYEYLYESESFNSLNGQLNGPKASCKVEIAVPKTCSFILRTRDCSLSEVIKVDADGNPVLGKAAGEEDFKTVMEKYSLKFTIRGDDDIQLFPEEGERINILNIKRGIISALAVPLLEEDRNKDMPTIYGLCPTDYIMSTGENAATEVTFNRDLSSCDQFKPIQDHTSPLALITGMHHLLAQLISSKQTCSYKFDDAQLHMTSGVCNEKHNLLPLSIKKKYGYSNTGKQVLTLLGITEYIDRAFDNNVANIKPLHLDSSVDKSPIQDKEAVLTVLRELVSLSKTKNGCKRAHLAQKLVTIIRKMETETLTAALPDSLDISRSLTYQALLQCGTPECSSAFMQVFRTFDRSSVETDAGVYAMGMVPQSSRVLVKEMLITAKIKPSKPIYYALSNAVRRLYETDGVTSEIQAVAHYALEQIGDCSGDQEHVFLSLRVIGNMVAALGAANPALHSAVIQCINQPKASSVVQQAAIQVYRQIPIPEEGREELLNVVLDRATSVQKRVAAYLVLMKNPMLAELTQIAAALQNEQNHQAKSFIISHMSNILSSSAPETQDLRYKIREAFQSNEIGMIMEPNILSQYYRLGSLKGNMIFESPNELPREVMLEMTLNAFGFDMDLIEIGIEGKGFDPIVEALFGDDGFFPDTVMKTILYATDKMPAQLSEVLDNILPIMTNDRKKRQATQNIVKEISHSVNKLFEDLKAQNTPEAMVYLRLLGAELGYLDTKDGKMIHNLLQMIPTDFVRRLFSSVDNEFFLHYIFMDNEFYLPTGAGFPLRVALSGTFTPGIKGGLNFNPGNKEFAFMLSAGIEFVTEMGTHFPDYVHSGLEMHTSIYHESGLKAKLTVTKGQLKLSIPAPNGPTELFSVTNSLSSVIGAKILPISAKGRYLTVGDCISVFPGLNHCAYMKYLDEELNNTTAFSPLTGDTKFAVELQPSGTVTEYTATFNYAYEEEADTVTFALKAEGTPHEAISTVILNRKEETISAELLIESLQIESKISAKCKRAEKMTLEFESDLKLPTMTSVQTIIIKYESEKIEAEVRSHVNYEIQRLISNMNVLETIFNRLLESQTEEDRIAIQEILYLWISDTPVMIFPENMFLNVEIAGKYHFGQPYYTITLPLPLGGKSTQDLNFPTTLTIPNLDVPLLDLELESSTINLPEIFIPVSVLLSVPSFKMAEMSGKLSNNLYNLEAALSAARDPAAQSTYSAKVEVTGSTPIDLLSLKVEGSALVEATSEDSIRANMKTVFQHEIINVTVSVEEALEVAEKLSVKSKSTVEALSCVGVKLSLKHTGTFEVDAEQISGDGNLEAAFKASLVNGSGTLKQSVSLLPYRPEAKIDSSMKIDSTLLRAQNYFALAVGNGELLILSNTTALDNRLTNIAKITFRESQLALNSHTKTEGFGLKINNMAETKVGAKAVSVKIETSTDRSKERIHSLLTGVLDINGLAIHSDASAKLKRHTADHKSSLIFSKDTKSLTTRGTTSLKSIFTKEELKQTFEIVYKNLSVTLQCKTIGSIMGEHVKHNTKLQIDGLSGSIRNHLLFNSRVFNIETNTRGTTNPAHFSFEATADGDESWNSYGRSRCQFNTKALLKVEPQSIVHTHDIKICTVLDIDRSFVIESELESKSDIQLIPSEQKAQLTVKTKINKYATNQEITVYNNQAQLGLEGSGSVVTNLFNTADTAYQNLTISGFLKYDKSSDSHSVSLPFIENLLQLPDNIRTTCVITGETLRNYINREGISSKIQIFPQLARDFVSKLNFERRAVQLKHALISLSQEYALKLELLRGSQIRPFEKLLSEMGSRFSEALGNLKENTVKNTLIEDVVEILSSLFFSLIEDVKLFLSSIKTQGHAKLNEIFYPTSPGNPLQIPAISRSLSVPSFGKLFGEVRFSSPFYNIRTSAEIKNASRTIPLFTAFIESKGTSTNLKILNYNLDSIGQISFPEMSHVKVTESLKLTHMHLTLDQEATLTLNGSASDNANISSYSLETSFKNQINIPSHFMSSEVTLIQKAVACQDDAEVTLTVKNKGIRKFALKDFSDEGTHKSDLDFKIGLSAAKLTLIGYTDSDALQMKMNVNADAIALSHLNFNASVETKSPFIKTSSVVASGTACFSNMTAEFKAFHNTEFFGAISGVLSNTATFFSCPFVVAFDFVNSGNGTIALHKSFSTCVDFQNDYSLAFNPELHRVSTVAVAQLNNYNYKHNFTANHNTSEMGIYTIVNIETSFWFLNAAEMFIPVIIRIPEDTFLNFSDNTELWDDLTTNDQNIYLHANFIYQKSLFDPRIDIPSLGNLTSEVFFESPVLNLSANAGIHPKNYSMRISATTESPFKQLGSRLDGATRLTTENGLQVASSFYLDNAYIQGNHNSTVTLKDKYQAVLAADTVAKFNLTTYMVDANHQLSADTKANPKALSHLNIKYAFDHLESKSVNHGEVNNTLKLDASLSFISIETATQATTDYTPLPLFRWVFFFIDVSTANGTLNNEVNIYVQVDGLKSNLTITGNGYVESSYSKLFFDVDDQMTMEGDLERMYSSLDINSNYTLLSSYWGDYKIKHTTRGETVFLPLSTLVAAVDFFLSQPDRSDYVYDGDMFPHPTAENGWLTKLWTYSRWFNSSTDIYVTPFPAELMLDFFYNFTSPSLHMKYQGGLYFPFKNN